jgi:predicted TIM-barrel fold metal-dependent hydrolase
MRKLGFGGALVSSIEAIFTEDSYPAEEVLARDLSDHPELLHYKVVNPKCHWWKRDLDRAVDELGVVGIRLVCRFHGHDLEDPDLGAALEYAAETDLPAVIHYRMQDYRTQWMMQMDEPPDGKPEDLVRMLQRPPVGRLVLAGLHYSDILSISEHIEDLDTVLVDTSRLKGPWRTLEKLGEKLDVGGSLAYGSLWPLCIPECPLEQITNSALSEGEKERILGGNLSRLLPRLHYLRSDMHGSLCT